MSLVQVHLLRDVVTMVTEGVTHLILPLSSVGASSAETNDNAPSPTNATPTTLPLASEVSTASSYIYQGLSSLWLQLLLSKFTLNLYGQDERGGAGRGRGLGCEGCSPIRVSLGVESVSMQLDVQERCSDVIFKVSSMECEFSKLSSCQPPAESLPPGHPTKYLSPGPPTESPPPGRGHCWVPYFDGSNGKFFSTTRSNLSDEFLQSTAPFTIGQMLGRSPGQQGSEFISSSSSSSPTFGTRPKFQPSFLYLKGHLPRGDGAEGGTRTSRTCKVELNVCSFEAVVWVPVWRLVQSVTGGGRGWGGGGGRGGGRESKPLHQVKGCHIG